jgi:Pyruvate/2-oxoglutarate dehydrogenase complex, dihydrolipoamide acyltransferase (E2) component, and related enzymes
MPSVRQYARDKGVDLAKVTPSGKHGQITKADVDSFDGSAAPQTAAPAAAAAPQAPANTITPYKSATPELETREKMSMTRKAIAKAMLNSKHTAPHVTSFDDVEVSALMANRKKYKAIAADKAFI